MKARTNYAWLGQPDFCVHGLVLKHGGPYQEAAPMRVTAFLVKAAVSDMSRAANHCSVECEPPRRVVRRDLVACQRPDVRTVRACRQPR